jgi:hypothetical protein
MSSALLTEHVKPRAQWGWHFHGHCVVEFTEGTDVEGASEKLQAVWQRACKEESGREKELFRRKVCDAGEKLEAGSLSGQGELWSEAVDAVQRVLQYAIRDVVQGCEEWVERLRDGKEIAEFAAVIQDSKLHRLFGEWRKAVEVECVIQTTEETAGESATSGSRVLVVPRVWQQVGTMEAVWEDARRGDMSALGLLQTLCTRYANRGKLCQRLLVVVNCVSAVRRAG